MILKTRIGFKQGMPEEVFRKINYGKQTIHREIKFKSTEKHIETHRNTEKQRETKFKIKVKEK